MSRTISSRTPAANACRIVDAPPAMSTSPSSPAASTARAYAASNPSVTKWNVVPPSISTGSRGVVGEHEHRRVVRRLFAPPTAPRAVHVGPLAADRAEHVAAHHVGTARLRRMLPGDDVSLVDLLVCGEHPPVEVLAADAERLLEGLVGPGQEAVERDGHVAGGVGHGVSDSFGEGDSSVGSSARPTRERVGRTRVPRRRAGPRGRSTSPRVPPERGGSGPRPRPAASAACRTPRARSGRRRPSR